MTKIKLWIGITIIIYLIIYISNNWIENKRYTIHSDKIDEPIRIVHLSDLHGKQFGKNNYKLFDNIVNEKPDIIVFTGDLTDSYRNNNIKESVDLLERLSLNTPVYYIRGNHEFRSSKYQEILKYLSNVKGDFHMLDGNYQKINIHNQEVNILGLDNYRDGVMDEYLLDGGYKILLNHYSENFMTNANFSLLNIDVLFTGHSHGGQWRLPTLGGIYSPGQGFFPKYYEGIHEANDSTQIISRGLGNSIFPIRILNRPEVITVVVD